MHEFLAVENGKEKMNWNAGVWDVCRWLRCACSRWTGRTRWLVPRSPSGSPVSWWSWCTARSTRRLSVKGRRSAVPPAIPSWTVFTCTGRPRRGTIPGRPTSCCCTRATPATLPGLSLIEPPRSWTWRTVSELHARSTKRIRRSLTSLRAWNETRSWIREWPKRPRITLTALTALTALTTERLAQVAINTRFAISWEFTRVGSVLSWSQGW